MATALGELGVPCGDGADDGRADPVRHAEAASSTTSPAVVAGTAVSSAARGE
ncbi:hypothetical protein [Streptomyces sp. Inha503]|uniref:hypothetical protein n=1 Tax=Streptomyces sp. Inha503 TaxID=3383314 RepID=UPI0039A3C2AE